MTQVVIENPIINSPYAEPTRHSHFGDEGITKLLSILTRIMQFSIDTIYLT